MSRSESDPILQFTATNIDKSKCPFVNPTVNFTLSRSSCLHLAGPSGAGKTTLANYIAGILPPRSGKALLRDTLGVDVAECAWHAAIPEGERVGMLFQQTTLLDSLTVAGNVCVALEHCPAAEKGHATSTAPRQRAAIKRLLETVGLDYLRDGGKRPAELSGGMARRASLALQLAQKKHVIVLDEPFAGLDYITAVRVAKVLEQMRREQGTALLLISHEPEIVSVVMGNASSVNGAKTPAHGSNHAAEAGGSTVTLERRASDDDMPASSSTIQHPSLFGKDPYERFLAKLLDYFLYSLPLILLTFLASGLAIAMLSSDILRRVDVTDKVLSVVQGEVKPLIQMFTGEEEVNPMYSMMINMKVRGMLDATIPPAKATLYAMGMAKLFVLEIGPLITSLLLSGRIGGSYAGEVATMQATCQNKLLVTLGVSPVAWTFAPALAASWIAAPLLTLAGTVLALEIGARVGPLYGIGDAASYRREVRDAVLVPLRLRGVAAHAARRDDGAAAAFSYLDPRCTFSDWYWDALVEIATHPVCFHLIKSVVFMSIVMGVAEVAARREADLTPRGVPRVITTSVVGGSLLVIFADWGFSQLLLKRH